MKVAIIHDWLTGMRGGEKCLEVFCELFPSATIFTLFYDKGKLSDTIESMDIKTSYIQKLPFAEKKYRSYLPLFPSAIEHLDLNSYDLILSSSHCVAKGIIPPPKSLHICYCYTPMRYVWDLYQDYIRDVSWFTKKVAPYISNYLRSWDIASSGRVDSFVAISNHVKQRIARYYRKEAEVIYPPVDMQLFSPSTNIGDYFLIVSALVPYKRLDIAIEAFNRLNYPLKVIGIGPEEKKLRAIAKSPKIEFLGWQTLNSLRKYYSECKALIFPGVEDFGITVLEAQASGRPVIAYGKGGVIETVIPLNSSQSTVHSSHTNVQNPTGIFFYEQTPEALISAIIKFEKAIDFFDPIKVREHVIPFDRSIFKEKIRSFIEERYNKFLKGSRSIREQIYAEKT